MEVLQKIEEIIQERANKKAFEDVETLSEQTNRLLNMSAEIQNDHDDLPI